MLGIQADDDPSLMTDPESPESLAWAELLRRGSIRPRYLKDLQAEFGEYEPPVPRRHRAHGRMSGDLHSIAAASAR